MSDLSNPVGRKVVCLYDHFPPAVHEYFDSVPLAGEIYTIGEIFWAKEHRTRRDMLSLRLVEIPPLRPGFGFSLWRFRLVDDEHLLQALEEELVEERQRQKQKEREPLPA